MARTISGCNGDSSSVSLNGGLILTGKSIAKFPELKERFAEYFLIGTLLSMGLAVLGVRCSLSVVWDNLLEMMWFSRGHTE